MNFDFSNPTKLITGKGCINANSGLFSTFGKSALIVTGGSSAKKSGALDDVINALDDISYVLFDRVQPNPLLMAAYEASEIIKSENIDFIIAIGGGSPLDSAKATAVYAANQIEPLDIYDLSWKNPPLPIIAIGTTAGTGSEVGPAAVLTTPDGIKKSIAHSQLYPVIAFGDPSYTMTLPLDFTVSTALDALSHSVEGYFASSSNAVSDIFALEAIDVLSSALDKLSNIKSAKDISYNMREQLYYASVMAGYTLAHCGTCYCHTLGYHLTEEYNVPHGTACAVFLPGFLKRAKLLVKDKAVKLEKRCGIEIEKLISLIENVIDKPDVILNDSTIKMVVKRSVNSKNFARTLPGGFTEEEALNEMRRLFANTNLL